MVSAAVICHEGIESVAVTELQELIKAEGKPGKAVVTFDVQKKEDLLKLIYLGQSIRKVLLHFTTFTIKKDIEEDLKTVLEKIDWKQHLSKDKPFRVSCKHIGDHDFSSQSLAEDAGAIIIDLAEKQLGFTPKVDLEHPATDIYLYVHDNECTVGIDLCPLDLSKRPYKLFTTSYAIKASIGYALIRMAGWRPDQLLVDPFCKEGIIPIEAALWVNGRSSHEFTKDALELETVAFFDGIDVIDKLDALDNEQKTGKVKAFGYAPQLPFLSNAKKNAKIANVQKLIEFSKVDVEWLDTKFDKETLDAIITRPPEDSARAKTEDIHKAYKELFYQADFVLKKTGKLVLLSNSLVLIDKWADQYNFEKLSDQKVWQGKMELHAVVLGKKKKSKTSA